MFYYLTTYLHLNSEHRVGRHFLTSDERLTFGQRTERVKAFIISQKIPFTDIDIINFQELSEEEYNEFLELLKT